MATPVGPAPRDPNDPDFWDWGGDDDDVPIRYRHPVLAFVAAVVVVAMVLAIVIAGI